MSKKKEKSREQNVQFTVQKLVTQHPILAERKPLALQIHLQIREANPDLTKTQIRRAMWWLVHSKKYLQELAEGGARYNLDGTENGTVSDEHQTNARDTLKLIQSRKQKPKPKQETARSKPVQKVTSIDAKAKAKPTVVIKKRRRVAAGGNEQLSLNQAS